MNATLSPKTPIGCSLHPIVVPSRLRILDLYCCAGGAGEGYRLAGFDVTGVDIRPQPKNPHRFVLADALEYLAEHGHEYDAIHASPPCQAYTKAGKQWRKEGREYPDMIAATRAALEKTGKPWVLENVPGAPLRNPVLLNGSVFGIRVHRPRLFETNFPLPQPEVPPMKPVKMGRPIREGDIVQPVGHFSGVAYAAREMGLPWMGQGELAQAIPPAYTKWIAEQLLRVAAWHNATIAHDGTPEGLARILSTLLGGITQESQQRAQDTLAANPAIESLTAQCGLTAEQTKQGLAAALTPTILEERAVRMSQPTLL